MIDTLISEINIIAENIKISCCHMRHAEDDDKMKMKVNKMAMSKKKVNKMDVSRMMMMR